MGKRREHLICLLLIVVIIGCLTHTSWGQEEDSVKIPYPSSLPARSDFSQEDILNHAQKSLDRSISILNIVATLMGVMVGLLALIFVIFGAWGFTEIRHWKELRGEIEKNTNEAKKNAEEIEKDANEAKKSAEEAKKDADEAKKAAEEAKPIIERLKKAEEEIDTFRERATHLPSLSEPFSEDQKRLLEEYGKKIEFFEACGVPLKPEDYLSRGYDFYQSNEYELALKAIDKAIELKPDFAVAWDNKGILLTKLDRYDEALKAHDKAIKLKPDFANPWYNKACAYSLKGDKENALKHLSKAIALDAKYNEKAKSDEDFKNLCDDEDFKRVVS